MIPLILGSIRKVSQKHFGRRQLQEVIKDYMRVWFGC